MPLASRRSRRSTIDIWPGFVDALSQLLMVIIFILLVFTAGQFYLSDALSGRDQALQRLQQQISDLGNLLAIERRANEELRLGAADVATQLKNSLSDRDVLTTRIADLAARTQEQTARADQATGKLEAADTEVSVDKDRIELQLKELESIRRDLDALKAVRAQLEAKVSALATAQQDAGSLRDRTKELEAQLASAQEKTVLAQKQIDDREVRLRDLGGQLDQATKALAGEKEVSSAARAQVDQLNAAIAALRDQLGKLSAALDLANTKAEAQQGLIVDLGKRLNIALANKVEELARYRSEFFGKLREIIGTRPDIRIVGDRFVFQSEVLFKPGSDELADAAKTQLDPVIDALKQISSQIPPNIDWILRVDGHTDKRPISTTQFASNWELSAARAISVVRYAMDKGIPANRLAATGFADTQPIDTGDTDEAYRKNRRIELKLTER